MTKSIIHPVNNQESMEKCIHLIMDHLIPLMPRISSDDIEQAAIKFHERSVDQRVQDMQSCEAIKSYLNSLNIYFQLDNPKYVSDPYRGPMQIEITHIAQDKPIYYCPQKKDGRLKINTLEFEKAMDVFSKPESLLLFQ
jgi:hypothetical protein